jgi:hypothetical protein
MLAIARRAFLVAALFMIAIVMIVSSVSVAKFQLSHLIVVVNIRCAGQRQNCDCCTYGKAV